MKTGLLGLFVLVILLYAWLQHLRQTPYGRLTTRSALVAWRYGDRPVTSLENQRENMAASRKMIFPVINVASFDTPSYENIAEGY